jgi:putative membrane protein
MRPSTLRACPPGCDGATAALRQSRAMPADTSWTFEPGAIALLALATGVYVARWRRARAQAGPAAADGWRLTAFLSGIGVTAAALLSPLDRLGEQAFVMHMVQHVLLLDVASILLILGLTKVILRPATRRLRRLEEAAGPLGTPVFAVIFYVSVMWVWHVPALYDAALEHAPVHVLEHLVFSGAGLLYWWHLLSPLRTRLRFGGMGPVVYMASTKLLVGLLGIVLTFAPDALYSFYEHHPQIWGLKPSTDQGLAGAVMATEQSIVMGIALAWLFVRALGESEREEEQAERYEAV